jgi:type VI secretion system protein ImpL
MPADVERMLLPLLIVLLVCVIVLIAAAAYILYRSRKPAGDKEPPAESAGTQLDRSVQSSLSILRYKASGRDYRYNVPWVLTVGAPSGGRSTLLNQLATESSDDSSSLAWRFLPGGAVIDVPGSFLIGHNGRAAVDGQWKRLLRNLERHRPHRPADGLVLTIAAPDLIAGGDENDLRKKSQAVAIRAKLDQLQAELGMVLPVYVLITKCDHIQGFGSFLERINPDLSDDLFGWSNSSTLESTYSADWVDEAFGSIANRLLELQVGILSRPSAAPVDDLFLFPIEFERMHAPLRAYLTEIFQETSYVEPNFLRGIYFCGAMGTHQHHLAALPAAGAATVDSPTAPDSSLPAPILRLKPFHPTVAFVRQLFDRKVFPESKIARAVRGPRFTRDHALLAARIALALFVLVFSVGTTAAYFRLANLRDTRFANALDLLVARVSEGGAANTQQFTVAAAYDLVDTIGVLDAKGFRSVFLPASWRDPINSGVAIALSDSFSKMVLPALSHGLEARAETQMGSCAALPPIDQTLPTDVDALAQIRFQNDLEYQQLDKSLSDYNALRRAIGEYDQLRSPVSGTFQQLNDLFRYLLNRGMDDARRFQNNQYYARAIQHASGQPVPKAASGELDQCVGLRTASEIQNFLGSWFGDNNPAKALAGGVAEEINGLQSGPGQTRERLRFLVDDVRRLDALLSGGSYGWLRETNFNIAEFPALSTAIQEPFADIAFVRKTQTSGSEDFTQFKSDLLSINADTIGLILSMGASEVKVSQNATALATCLDALLNQDFMADNGTVSYPAQTTAVFWNKTALGRATQLLDSYDKFAHDRLPLLPSGVRNTVATIAQNGLQSAVLTAVARAQEPVNTSGTSPDAATLMLEIRSFEDALPVLAQIGNSLSSPGGGTRADLNLMLAKQAGILAQQMTALFQASSFYAPSLAGLMAWDGNRQLSLVDYDVENADDLEQYLGAQRDLLKSVALDYALPLQQYLQSRHLQSPDTLGLWTKVIKDVQDYEAKKPGNSIAALETFIRTDLDKINVTNGCLAVVPPARGSDYFVGIRAKLQTQALDQCGDILLDQYTRNISAFFNSKLSGRFPFGPVPKTPDAPESDPRDVVKFLHAMEQTGNPLAQYLRANSSNPDVLAFLTQADAVRQLFGGGLKDDSLWVDTKIYFRVNRQAEVAADHIIDWSFQAGDSQVASGSQSNGVRWAFGVPTIVKFRFAKDSPDIPVAGASGPDARIDGRSVSYEYRDPWSLLTLLRLHSNSNADYGVTAGGTPGTLRFAIPTAPDTSRSKLQTPQQAQGQVRLFLRLTAQVPGVKEPHEVLLPDFPESAPTLHAVPTQVSSN